MAIALITPPAVLPVSLAAAKEHLRVEHDHEDDLIDRLIASALDHAQALSGQKFVSQTWRQYLDCWPVGGLVSLEVSPVNTLVEVRYFDTAGDPVVMAASEIEIDAISQPARIVFSQHPAIGRQMNGIEIDCIAGYGAVAEDVPILLRTAVLHLISAWYEVRGTSFWQDGLKPVPASVYELIAPYRNRKL